LNRLAGRRGKVFPDRFHSHVMKCLRELVYAVRYVLENFRHHLREDVAPEGADRPVSLPRTWLLRQVAGPPAARAG